jgi:hypothetical protein
MVDVILRRARRARLEGWKQTRVWPSFETPAFGGLLRMTFYQVSFNDYLFDNL